MPATGLAPDDVRKLSNAQRRELVAWTLGKAGGNLAINPFVPAAIRGMALEQRLELAGDPARDAAWEEHERRKVASGYVESESGLYIPGWIYFTEAYGSIQPPTGPRIPFTLWPEQRELALELREWLRWIILKARQLGLTWLALHDAVHLIAYDPDEPAARVLALSRTGGDASKLLQRARAIADNTPAFLRPLEAPDTRRSMTRYGVLGRGDIVSLMGTPDAPRMETATLIILDEFGFYRNKGASATWTAAQPTLGTTGRAYVISTGNGDEETPGDGQAFAQLVRRAEAGAADESSGKRLRLAFLPTTVDPARTREWLAAERETYITDEEFEAEHPETIDQALQGQPGTKVYPLAGIAAAERLGRIYDEMREQGELPAAAAPERREVVAIDWGEHTHALELWPLEGGGFYAMREVVHANREPGELVDPLLEQAYKKPAAAHYDAAGVQSMRTFVAKARRTKWPNLRSVKIPFGDYKAESVNYARRLFRRSAALVAIRDELRKGDVARARELAQAPSTEGGLGMTAKAAEQITAEAPPALRQIAAISPEGCPVFLRQLRGLEFDDDDAGKVAKGDDHGPDAWLAGIAPTARRYRAELEAERQAQPAGD